MLFDEFFIKALVRAVPDWPRKGMVFRDVAPLFRDPKALRMVADSLVQRYIDCDLTHVAAVEARGFPLGAILTYELNLPLVLIRKQGKLPPETISQSYQMEYDHQTLEISADALGSGDRVLLVDDLIATGNTLLSASMLIRELGAKVSEVAAIIDLPDLQGSTVLGEANIPVYTLCAFDTPEAD